MPAHYRHIQKFYPYSHHHGLLSATVLLATLLGVSGCGSHTYGPATALRSPNNFVGSGNRLSGGQTPHPLLVVELPNHPGQPAKIDTVVSALLPHHISRPVRTPTVTELPTKVNVVELPLRPTTRSANGRPASSSADHAVVPAR